MAYVFTCAKWGRPISFPTIKPPSVACCGVEIRECERTTEADADKRYRTWKTRQPAKIGENVEQAKKKRKTAKGGGKR